MEKDRFVYPKSNSPQNNSISLLIFNFATKNFQYTSFQKTHTITRLIA